MNMSIHQQFITPEYITFLENYVIYKGVRIMEIIHQTFSSHKDYNDSEFVESVLFDESDSINRFHKNQPFINAFKYYSFFANTDIISAYVNYNNIYNKINERYTNKYYTENNTTSDYVDLEPFYTYTSLINIDELVNLPYNENNSTYIDRLEIEVIQDIKNTYIKM